YGLICDLM
ncbi:unnamed protein product, partial [Lathyrus oleraceus]